MSSPSFSSSLEVSTVVSCVVMAVVCAVVVAFTSLSLQIKAVITIVSIIIINTKIIKEYNFRRDYES